MASTTAAALKPADQLTEQELRVDLAACYRLVAHYGMDDLIFTHISARIPGAEDHFLINRHGMLFHEVTASSLVRVDLAGNIVAGEGPVSRGGFGIHGAIHAARPDARCVLHTHTPAGVAVACLEEGLTVMSQHSIRFAGDIGYYDYEGLAIDLDDNRRLVESLGTHTALIMRNHGLLTVGPTIADAFFQMLRLNETCELQLTLQATGRPVRGIPSAVIERFRQRSGSAVSSVAQRLIWPGLLRLLEGTDYRD